MGEYAEIQWQQEMYRGFRDWVKPRAAGRNPVAANCPHCGKGIRPVAGSITESMAAHIKAKRCDIAAKEGQS